MLKAWHHKSAPYSYLTQETMCPKFLLKHLMLCHMCNFENSQVWQAIAKTESVPTVKPNDQQKQPTVLYILSWLSWTLSGFNRAAATCNLLIITYCYYIGTSLKFNKQRWLFQFSFFYKCDINNSCSIMCYNTFCLVN
jgi:hypothetical protein